MNIEEILGSNIRNYGMICISLSRQLMNTIIFHDWRHDSRTDETDYCNAAPFMRLRRGTLCARIFAY